MMVLCFNTLAMEADVGYFALLPHHVGMDVVGVIRSDWVRLDLDLKGEHSDRKR